MHTAVPFRSRIVAEAFERDLAHARHNPQTEHDIFGIGDLEADLGQRRICRAHDVGNDEHRAPAHSAREQLPKFRICLGWVRPVIRWAGFLFRWCADKSELLDARHVVRIRPVQIRPRNSLLVEFHQHILVDRLTDQKLMLALRAVAPENVLRLCQRRDLVHPIEHSLIVRLCITDPLSREYGGREILHRTKLPILTMNPPTSRRRHARSTRIKRLQNRRAEIQTKFEVQPLSFHLHKDNARH